MSSPWPLVDPTVAGSHPSMSSCKKTSCPDSSDILLGLALLYFAFLFNCCPFAMIRLVLLSALLELELELELLVLKVFCFCLSAEDNDKNLQPLSFRPGSLDVAKSRPLVPVVNDTSVSVSSSGRLRNRLVSKHS